MLAGSKPKDIAKKIGVRARFSYGNRALTPISRERGFAYLALLLIVAVSGALLAAAGVFASHDRQREKEADLIFAGDQYREAIRSYYERSPGGAKRYPQKLEDLLQDARLPATLRHLRKLYLDPVTGKPDWGIVEAPQGGIMGVYSLSEDAPIKTGEFSKADETFADSQKYSDWKFTYSPPGLAASR
jgi:type II secretory pathway pseudopilin PulG